MYMSSVYAIFNIEALFFSVVKSIIKNFKTILVLLFMLLLIPGLHSLGQCSVTNVKLKHKVNKHLYIICIYSFNLHFLASKLKFAGILAKN